MTPDQQPHHNAASLLQTEDTNLPEMDNPAEAIPVMLVPYSRDDDRCRYLGLRSSGFGIRETLQLLCKHKSTLSSWRTDPTFVKLEESLPELRKTLALEYTALEFLRNYRLILEKDRRVLHGSMNRETVKDKDGNERVSPQDAQDFQYLLRLRAHYTPQQLQAVEQLFSTKDPSKEFHWQDFMLRFSQTKDGSTLEVGTRQKQESGLGLTSEGQ